MKQIVWMIQENFKMLNQYAVDILPEPIHSSTAEKTENQTPIQDQRCQSGPPTKNSVIPSERDSSKNYGTDQWQSPHTTFICWKMTFETEVWTCSQFPAEPVHWIKEKEMVDSVVLKSSSSARGIGMPNFEVLDAKIDCLRTESSRIPFRKVNLEEQKAQKEDRFLHGRQIAYLIHEHFFFFREFATLQQQVRSNRNAWQKKKRKPTPFTQGMANGGDHWSPPWWVGWSRRSPIPCAPTARDQKLSQHCTPEEWPTSASTPDELSHANAEALIWPLLWPAGWGNQLSSDQRPATSQARTTSRVRPNWPVSSG